VSRGRAAANLCLVAKVLHGDYNGAGTKRPPQGRLLAAGPGSDRGRKLEGETRLKTTQARHKAGLEMMVAL
jgi:hypothetical protein